MRPCQPRSYTMGGQSTAERAEAAEGTASREKPRKLLRVLCDETLLTQSDAVRPLPVAAKIARAAPAFAWGHACAPEANGFAPAGLRAHTFPWPGIRRLAIHDRKCEPYSK